ncbi:hypothetical protein [Aquimarina algiphila]|uniref:hypothetical protein n=2 Tax=Aquimarina algiphila TaxID=2047982 RepID=UPI0024936204|nr:hypothetical protein [Aquimarina algiphila]
MKKQILVIMIIFFFSCTTTEVKLEPILGVKDVIFNMEFSNVDYLSMSGEGFSISIYDISTKSTKDFLNSNEKLNYPEYKEGFKHISWTKAPLKNELKEVINLSVGYYSRNDKVQNYQSEIKKNLEGTDSYYAVDYKEEENNIIEIYLYVFDSETRKLYCVYNNV